MSLCFLDGYNNDNNDDTASRFVFEFDYSMFSKTFMGKHHPFVNATLPSGAFFSPTWLLS